MTNNYYQQQPSGSYYYQPKPEPILPWYTPQLVSFGFMLVWGVWQYRRLQRQQQPRYSQPKQATQIPTSSVKQLEAKLITMMNGDSKAAYRLVQLTQSRNPEMSVQWCWEKVIMDLERDHRI